VDEYTRTNLDNWESRVPVHTGPQGYDLDRYVKDQLALSRVVTLDAPRLGDLMGQRVVHLQCHIGTDTLSLARLGAEVTGVDFSPSALAAARQLAERAGPAVRYVQATLDEVPERLQETFDLVYTGVGALNWLPSAATVGRHRQRLAAAGWASLPAGRPPDAVHAGRRAR
jgi:2-polyprenyl-3-methyl-5-hydroxy-6-metoxy-1,4-benzoquinol methylase